MEYFVLAHFSKLVRPKAIRIESNEIDGISNVAFENIDKSIVLVLCNHENDSKMITISLNNEFVSYEVKGNTAVTLYFS